MRIRTIKPEFWTNEKLCELPEGVHLFAAALLNYADDEGFFNANPRLIHGAIYPLREPSVSVQEMLTELSRVDYLRLSSGTDGRQYGVIVNFSKHQKVNRPTASKIKGLANFTKSSLRTQCTITDPSLPEQGTGNREQGSYSSLRSESSNISVSTSGDLSLSLCDPGKHSESTDKIKTKTKTKQKTDGSTVWEAYSESYEQRYGTPPLRNAKTNSLCSRLVTLVGAPEAPDVARYYLTTRAQPYAGSGHCLELLVRDAGKIHTEWSTGNRITQSQSHENDRLQGQGDIWRKVMRERGEP